MRDQILAAALAATMSLGGAAAMADVIELRADYWCPFNCNPEDDRPGFMVEIAREALAEFGHEVRYQTMNWTRSLDYARSGRINGVIGTDPDESPELVFGTPIATYQEATAFRPGESRTLETAADLDGLRIGGISEYEYSTEAIAAYIAEHGDDGTLVQILPGDNALVQNLRKLEAGRVDLVPEDFSVLRYTLDNIGMQDAFEIVLSPEVSELYIAFSPALDSSDLYAAQLGEGLQRLRTSGRLEEILARYGLTE